METGCNQHTENRAINHRDDGTAGERTGTRGTTHKFIPAEAEAAANNDANDDAQNHGFKRLRSSLPPFPTRL